MILCGVFLLVFGLAGNASATVIPFATLPSGNDVYMQGGTIYNFSYDLNNLYNPTEYTWDFMPGTLWLKLWFTDQTNDPFDLYNDSYVPGITDYREYVSYRIEGPGWPNYGSGWEDLGEIDTTDNVRGVNDIQLIPLELGWLTDDGILDFELEV